MDPDAIAFIAGMVIGGGLCLAAYLLYAWLEDRR